MILKGLGQFGEPPGDILEEGIEKDRKGKFYSTHFETLFSTISAN